MKIRSKLLLLIACLIVTLSLTACVIVPSDGSSSSTLGGAINPSSSSESYNVTINVETATENQYSSLVEMLEAVRPSVVEIYVSSGTAVGTGAGSGVVVSSLEVGTETASTADDYIYYYIMTCHHVIDGTDTIVIKDLSGNQFDASLIGGDPQSDIAVLKVGVSKSKESNLAVATIRDINSQTTPLKVGEDVVNIGNPLGFLGGTVTKGIVSTLDRSVSVEGNYMMLIQTDCASNPGNSGGGLFDVQGRLIGISNSGYSDRQGLNFAVPIDDAMFVYESLMETFFYESSTQYNFGYVEGRARVSAENAYALSFGYDIAFADYSTNMFSYYTYVMQVKTGSVYAKAGFKVGDYITAVSYKDNTTAVKGAASSALVTYLNELDVKIDDQIIFTVVRNGVSLNLTVTYKQFIYGDTGCTPSTK